MLSRYEQFSFIVSGINRHIQKLEHDEMVKHGCKGAYAQYLVAMRHYPQGVTAAQLSEICDKDKAAVSRIVAEMIDKGLIVRKAASETMYRAKLTLSAEGEKVAEYIVNRASAAIEAMGDELSDEQRITLYKTLDTISHKLYTLTREGIPQK